MARERIFFDGWELTDGTAYDWEYRSGTDSAAAPSGQNGSVPNRDGELWVPKAAGPGSFSIALWVAGKDRAEVEANWRTVLRAARRRHRLINVIRYLASGEKIECAAELVGQLEPTHLGQVGMRANLTFSVPSGFWRSQTIYTHATVAGTALPQTLVLYQLAESTEAMVNLTYQVKGAITAPKIVDRTDAVDGDSVLYNKSIPSGQSITFDSSSWEISGTGGLSVDQSKVFPTGRRLMTVVAARPGDEPSVQLRGSGGNSDTQLIVTGRRAYAC